MAQNAQCLNQLTCSQICLARRQLFCVRGGNSRTRLSRIFSVGNVTSCQWVWMINRAEFLQGIPIENYQDGKQITRNGKISRLPVLLVEVQVIYWSSCFCCPATDHGSPEYMVSPLCCKATAMFFLLHYSHWLNQGRGRREIVVLRAQHLASFWRVIWGKLFWRFST